jgi:hypothetical protein
MIVGHIYKINMDDMTEIIKISDDVAGEINIVGDWVYYSNKDDEDSSYYRIRKDGTDRQRVN